MQGKNFKLFFIACSILNGIRNLCAQKPMSAPDASGLALFGQTTSQMIVAALRQSQAQVQDFNGDGEINCMDYSCSFKAAWDSMYPDQKERCELVRNKNPLTGMHHLFALVKGGMNADIEVETWAFYPDVYDMQSNWTDGRYDRKYNIYGETKRWMRECGLW